MIQYFKNRDLFPGIVKSMQNDALGMKNRLYDDRLYPSCPYCMAHTD